MARKNYNLNNMKRKPSALLVYLALLNNKTGKPMGRPEIIDYIKQNFGGIEIQPKTVSESVAILKALSVGPNPVLHFRQCGKNGYVLSRGKSVFSTAETLRIIECFSSLGVDPSKVLFDTIRPLLSDGDVAKVQTVLDHLIQSSPASAKMSAYKRNFDAVVNAMVQGKEVRFTHRFEDMSDESVKEVKGVQISPHRFFFKRGHVYVIGTRLADLSQKRRWTTLYVADIDHIHNASIANDDAEPYCDKIPLDKVSRDIQIAALVPEGVYYASGRHHELGRGYRFVTKDLRIFELIENVFGRCYRITSKKLTKMYVEEELFDVIRYEALLYADWNVVKMLALAYPHRIEFEGLDSVELQFLNASAQKSSKLYQPDSNR